MRAVVRASSCGLLAVFWTRGREQRLYKPGDTHWNIAGNRLAAEHNVALFRSMGIGSPE